MRRTHRYAAWLGLALLGAGAAAGRGQPPAPVAPPQWPVPGVTTDHSVAPEQRPAPRAADVPLAALPARVRAAVRAVVEQPTLAATGPPEDFAAQPTVYRWL